MELVESIFYKGKLIDVYLIGATLGNLYVVEAYSPDFGTEELNFSSLKKAKAYVDGLSAGLTAR